MKKLLLILVAGIALVSCTGRDASDILVFHTQYADTVNAGAKTDFLVSAFTIHEKVVRVSFSSFDETFGHQDLGFVEPNVNNWSDHFYYDAPFLVKDTSTVRIQFIAEDNLGNTVRDEARLVVISKDRPLEDHSGLTLHSAAYGSSNGFCLRTRQLISVGEAQESEKDILLADDGSVSTATDAVFSLVPSFDYPSATRRSVDDTFRALTKSVSLPALKVDDVFLVGRKDPESGVMTAWGVFKVMAVFEEGTGVRLVLNYKYI